MSKRKKTRAKKTRRLRSMSRCVIAFLMITLFAVGCDDRAPVSRNANLFERLSETRHHHVIAASSYALTAMAELIVEEQYEVWTPGFSDVVPALDELRKLQHSDVLLVNGPGAAYATWLPMVTFDRQKVFETTTHSFELEDFVQVAEHQIVHTHGGEGEHSHVWMVPHCWLHPRLVLLQAAEVCDKLCELYPGDAVVFRQNFNRRLVRPLEKAVAEAADCQELIKSNGLSLVLSDPRLKHFSNAVQPDVKYLLWFEPEEISVARKQWNAIDAGRDANRLLLWARAPGPQECELTFGETWIQLDLIEAPIAGRGFVDRVRGNFGTLAAAIGEKARVGQSGN